MGAKQVKPPRPPGQGLSAEALRTALDAHAEALFQEAFGAPVRQGAAEWRARENDALAMQMRGDRRGLWCDHAADQGGDLFDLVAITRCGLTAARDDFPAVLEETRRITGAAPVLHKAARRRSRKSEDQKARAYEAALIRNLLGWVRPVPGTPAELYLASRGITRLPDDGLAFLPPVPRLPVRRPDCPSLVVWAHDAEGRETGGQRILLNEDGTRAGTDVPKPSFGSIRGHPARFGVTEAHARLIVAEGPETALAIWCATGCETWAVFGVSGWITAPLPKSRQVVLAPDRDAPKSPAGRAFARAVIHHMDHHVGGSISIAEAPEPERSKHDLADTLLRAGPGAVRAAIAGAQAPDMDIFRDRAKPAAPRTAPRGNEGGARSEDERDLP